MTSAGGICDINKTPQLSAQWVCRKEAYSSSATDSLLATCAVGL